MLSKFPTLGNPDPWEPDQVPEGRELSPRGSGSWSKFPRVGKPGAGELGQDLVGAPGGWRAIIPRARGVLSGWWSKAVGLWSSMVLKGCWSLELVGLWSCWLISGIGWYLELLVDLWS